MTETPENHDNELAKRRRVLELAHELADLTRDIGDRVKELRMDLHVSANDLVSLTLDNLPNTVRHNTDGMSDTFPFLIDALLQSLVAPPTSKAEAAQQAQEIFAAYPRMAVDVTGMLGTTGAGRLDELLTRASSEPSFGSSPIKRLLSRLFAEAPKVDGTDSAAIECQVALRSSGMPLVGALSTTPEGALKMLVPAENHGKKIFAEVFFDYTDVQAVILQREMKNDAPLIHRIST